MLALELGQASPRIVVTCSAESLSSKRAALTSPAGSAELHHPPTTVNAVGGGYSPAQPLGCARQPCQPQHEK